MGKVPVVLHQADRFVIGACAIQLGASQSVFVGDPALYKSVLRVDVGRDRTLDIGAAQQDAIEFCQALADEGCVVERSQFGRIIFPGVTEQNAVIRV